MFVNIIICTDVFVNKNIHASIYFNCFRVKYLENEKIKNRKKTFTLENKLHTEKNDDKLV